MTLNLDPAYPTDSENMGRVYADGGEHRLFRVGDNIVFSGDADGKGYIAAVDDEGVVFEPQQFVDAGDVGLGEILLYHVLGNGDGTMTLYYQVYDTSPLPARYSNWTLEVDAETGVATGPAREMETGFFSVPDLGLLQAGWSLPDGNIAAMRQGTFHVVDPEGTVIGSSTGVTEPGVFAIPRMFDLAVLGDTLALAYVSSRAGAAKEAFVRFFSMTGETIGEPITVSDSETTVFGVMSGVQIETLADGRFVVVWTDGSGQPADTEQGAIYFKIFNADGSLAVDSTLVNTITSGSQTNPNLVATATGFIVGYTDFEITVPFRNTTVLHEYDLSGQLVDSIDSDAYQLGGVMERADTNTAFIIGSSEVVELTLPGEDTPLDNSGGQPAVRGSEAGETVEGTEASERILALGGDDVIRPGGGSDTIDGGAGIDMIDFRFQPLVDGLSDLDLLLDLSLTLGVADIFGVNLHVLVDIENATGTGRADSLAGDALANALVGLEGADRLIGLEGDDVLDGGLGADTLNGGDGNDRITGGPDGHEADQRDVIYAGAGDDRAEGGGGNDQIFGQEGNDTLAGGFGADELQGQGGDDVVTGGALSDLVFGGDGDDFVNGGFGYDRINGGAGADQFFHLGVFDHGSDWVQDYLSTEGDVLVFGGAATAADFQINLAHTATADGDRSGDDAVQEAFIVHRGTGQILWALVDGEGQDEINIRIGGEIFDLLA
ncbi:hypothetical protein AB9K41_01690 [Cribrihabitans sp. XS_ASV171]